MVSRYKVFVLISILFSLIAAGYSINISSCQEINVSGIYTLNESINATSTCLEINSSDIILDCNGFQMIGNESGYGIYFSGDYNITVKNCNVQNFSIGYWFRFSLYSDFYNLSAINNSQYGLRLEYITDSSFNNISSYSNNVDDLLFTSASNNNTFNDSFFDSVYISDEKNNNTFDNITVNEANIASENATFRESDLGSCYVYGNSNYFEDIRNTRFDFYDNSSKNTITKSNITSLVLRYNTSTNKIYENYFSSPEIIDAYGFNVFNYSLNSTLNIGNYWGDFVCNQTVNNSGYNVCTDPDRVTINSTNSVYDYHPLSIMPVNNTPAPPLDTSLGPVIDSCGIINSSGIYVFNDSINAPTQYCINITSSDVRLDCNNFVLTGNQGIGLYIYSSSNVTLLNCNFDNFTKAIDSHFTTNSIFRNISINNSGLSIQLNYSGNNIIDNVSISNLSIIGDFDQNKINNSIIDEVLIGQLSENNKILNSIMNYTNILSSNNLFYNNSIYYLNIDGNYNTFTLNNFTLSNITSTDWDLIAHNDYNSSLSGTNLGNFWGEFNCSESESRGDFFVCTNKSSYSYQNISDVVDYAPLVKELIIPPAPPSSPLIANNKNISSCQRITDKGTYHVNSTLSDFDECLEIVTDNVSIDCQGNEVISTFNSAFKLTNVKNITIMNCRLRGTAGNSINAINVNDSVLINNSFESNDGLYLTNSENLTLFGNTFNNSNNLLYITSSTGIIFFENTFRTFTSSQMTFSSVTSSDLKFNTSVGNYWRGLNCLETNTSGAYYICNNPDNFTINSNLGIYDYEPLSEEFKEIIPFDDPFDDERDFEFRIKIDHNDFDGDDITCTLTIDDDYERNYTFNDDTPSDNFTITKYLDEEMDFDCDDELDDIDFRVEDLDGTRVYDNDYADESHFDYQLGEDRYKLKIDINDIDDDLEIDCELDLDNDYDVDFEFDDDSDSDDYTIVKYFVNEFIWSCDELVDDITFRVYDEDNDRISDVDKEDNDEYTYCVDCDELDDNEDDSSSSSSSSGSSSSSSEDKDNSSYDDDLHVLFELALDDAITEDIDLSDDEPTEVIIDNSWFEEILITSKKSVADSKLVIKKRSYNIHSNVVSSSDVKYDIDSSNFDVYDMITIEHEDISNDDIEEVTYKFKVQKSWLDEKNYTTDDVYVLRYTDNDIVEEIETELTKKDMDYYHFDASADGFSTYTIIAKKENVSEVIEDEVEENTNSASESKELNQSIETEKGLLGNETSTEDEPSLFVTIGKIFLGIVLLIGFLWFIK